MKNLVCDECPLAGECKYESPLDIGKYGKTKSPFTVSCLSKVLTNRLAIIMVPTGLIVHRSGDVSVQVERKVFRRKWWQRSFEL